EEEEHGMPDLDLVAMRQTAVVCLDVIDERAVTTIEIANQALLIIPLNQAVVAGHAEIHLERKDVGHVAPDHEFAFWQGKRRTLERARAGLQLRRHEFTMVVEFRHALPASQPQRLVKRSAVRRTPTRIILPARVMGP